jgi:hypothetical protein
MNMSLFGTVPFMQGIPLNSPEPLSRYLPLIADGIVASWLNKNSLPGSWILDPFGASPKFALDAARAGYRFLVTANNPITRFLIEMMANPPRAEELKAALAELAASYIGDQRIEPHIRSLYNTVCAHCGQIVEILENILAPPRTLSYPVDFLVAVPTKPVHWNVSYLPQIQTGST